MKLSQDEYTFLKKLIGIESTGASEVKDTRLAPYPMVLLPSRL
jgi:hypothetical protein